MLSWMKNQISTYAASAPYGVFITATMLLAAVALILLALQLAWVGPLRRFLLAQLASLALGAAAVGLAVLAYWKERARSLAALRSAPFADIRQQTFHDAGLLIFFDSISIGLLLVGVLLLVTGPGFRRRLAGLAVMLSGPLAAAALGSRALAWGVGLGQRIAFAIFTLGTIWVLLVLRSATHDLEA